jgi:hypothetical protein
MGSAADIHSRIMRQSEEAIRRSRELLAASEPLVRRAPEPQSPEPSPNGFAAPESDPKSRDIEPDYHPSERPIERAQP